MKIELVLENGFLNTLGNFAVFMSTDCHTIWNLF